MLNHVGDLKNPNLKNVCRQFFKINAKVNRKTKYFIFNLKQIKSQDSLEILHTFQLENYSYINFSNDIWNDQMIIFGGCTQDLQCTSDLIIYDLVNNSKKIYSKKDFSSRE